MMNQNYHWLRWIGVLPAAIAALLGAHFIIDFLYGISGYANRDTGFSDIATEYGIPIIASVLSGMVFILLGVSIAPLHKRNTAIILLVILACVSGIGIFTSLTFRYYFSAITAISHLAGGLAAYFQLEHDKKFEINLKRDSKSRIDDPVENDDEVIDYEMKLKYEKHPHYSYIKQLAELIKAHPRFIHLSDNEIWKAAIRIYGKRKADAVKKEIFDKYARIQDESLFPSKEQAQKIALSKIGDHATLIEITDDENKLKNIYNLQPGCWYVIYIDSQSSSTKSTSYIAISKVDGSIIAQGSMNDEG